MAAILNLEEGFYFSECIRAMVIPSLFPFLSVSSCMHVISIVMPLLAFPLCHDEVLTTSNQSDSTSAQFKIMKSSG